MIKNLTIEEREFMELFYNAKCIIETTFSGHTARSWNDGKPCITLRPYQRPFLGFDSALAEDNQIDEKENFRRRIKVGTKIIICGRKIGKTFIGLIANILLKLIHYNDKEITMASFDEKRVAKVLDSIREFLTNHKFYNLYKQRIVGSPEYELDTKNGNKLYGVNETIKGKSPGENWWGHHTFINFQDEIQAETEEAYIKKIDAISDFGVMEILCGITLITKTSPLGRLLKAKENKNNVIRLPQFISSLFDNIEKTNRVRAYGGEESSGYRINVKADIIEGALGAFDMERVRRNYNKKRSIKHFEISKQSYATYERDLIIEPIKNAEKTYVFSDIGDSAATEIGVIAKINNKYHLIYNITTYRLSLTQELPNLMEYIFKKVNADYISVDSTILGKPVYEILCEKLNTVERNEKGDITKVIGRVFWCAFNEDIATGFEKDEHGHIVRDSKGLPVEKKEPSLPFAVRRLNELFFDERFDIPDDDYKFDQQLSAYTSMLSGNRVIFDSLIGEDHYAQSMEVFAILEWLTDGLPNLHFPLNNRKPGFGSFGA